jgi:di/tricarboxylate transporter
MTIEIITVLALVVVAVILFVTGRLPIALVALLVMTTLLLIGVITPDEGLAGFSNKATVTITALFVLSAGLFKTGAVNFVGSLQVNTCIDGPSRFRYTDFLRVGTPLNILFRVLASLPITRFWPF